MGLPDLSYPPPERFQRVHGAHRHGHPVMLELDGQRVGVTRVVAGWNAHEGGFCGGGQAWAILLENGQRLVVFQDAIRNLWYLPLWGTVIKPSLAL